MLALFLQFSWFKRPRKRKNIEKCIKCLSNSIEMCNFAASQHIEKCKGLTLVACVNLCHLYELNIICNELL